MIDRDLAVTFAIGALLLLIFLCGLPVLVWSQP